MLKVKQTCLPTPGTHWSYGPGYMRGVSRASAEKLCGKHPPPKMGYETVVETCPDGWGGKYELCVQNISGTYFVASTAIRVEMWPENFNVEVVEPVE